MHPVCVKVNLAKIFKSVSDTCQARMEAEAEAAKAQDIEQRLEALREATKVRLQQGWIPWIKLTPLSMHDAWSVHWHSS